MVGLSASVEIRSCGNGVGGVGGAAGVGAGGRVLGLEETGGCSTARYGVTASKIPSSSSPDFITPTLPKQFSYATAESSQSRESYSTAIHKFQTFQLRFMSRIEAFHDPKLSKVDD